MKKLKNYVDAFPFKKYSVYWVEGGKLEKAEFSTETEIREESEEWLYALTCIANELIRLEVGQTLYVQMNRDNLNAKGVVVRTH